MVVSKAPFITFEGGEGSGKSTQIRMLNEYLGSQNIKTVLTREPGATPGGEAIRSLLVIGKENRWDAETDTLLYMAARRDNLTRIIWPSLEKGEWVLSDRFNDSTIVYQGCGRGLDRKHIETVYKFIAGDFKPDVTFLFDIDPKKGIERALHGKNRATHENRFENIDISFHVRLLEGYHMLAREEPDRFIIINADQTIEQVQSDLRKEIHKRFGV